jgi:hypothetical protein
MIQCSECEYFQQDSQGRRIFRCDPFCNIKEPECLAKWQLLRLDILVSHSQAVLSGQQKMAPIQDKLYKYVKRELDDLDESERWKIEDDDSLDSPPDSLS